ncbi:LOW QUALITY PROTEIN: hypothetical protein HZS_4102 [Henneguya salminicola]|nr:LOW QUALITY PROTEIN: hypothetical protein HZS_4102 [Henneguya salminicola]
MKKSKNRASTLNLYEGWQLIVDEAGKKKFKINIQKTYSIKRYMRSRKICGERIVKKITLRI